MNAPISPWASASEIATAVGGGAATASAVAKAALARIASLNHELNAFTDVTAERALARRPRVDADLARGLPAGPLAGVPFAVKNLFDVAGLPTRAGSRINRDRPPSTRDAALIGRMTRRGRRAGRSAQHGRIRLRLHRRERARRRLPQSARPRPHERRLLVGLWRRHRRRHGAGLARVGHQRLATGARLALRRLQPQADLRAAHPRSAPSPSSTASTISGHWRARRATSRSPTTCCRATTPPITPAPRARSSR